MKKSMIGLVVLLFLVLVGCVSNDVFIGRWSIPDPETDEKVATLIIEKDGAIIESVDPDRPKEYYGIQIEDDRAMLAHKGEALSYILLYEDGKIDIHEGAESIGPYVSTAVRE